MRREKPASHQPENTSVVPTDDAALRARCASNAPRNASSGTDCIATRRAKSARPTHYCSSARLLQMSTCSAWSRCPRARNTCPGANPNNYLYKCCRF